MMSNEEFNLILNNILGEVKPVYLRKNIFLRLYDIFCKKTIELNNLSKEYSDFKKQLINYIEHLKEDTRKQFVEDIRSFMNDCEEYDYIYNAEEFGEKLNEFLDSKVFNRV